MVSVLGIQVPSPKAKARQQCVALLSGLVGLGRHIVATASCP